MHLRLACINVPTSVGGHAWADCFEATAAHADIFGANEVFSKRAKTLFVRLAKRYRLSQYGIHKGPNPLFWDTGKYDRGPASHHTLHGARRSRWVGFNAARCATVVVLRPKQEGPDVTAINTHWVPRGPKVAAWWRARARAKSQAKVAHLVAAHAARGRVVVVMGDFNMDAAPKLAEVVWVAGAHHGVDKIGVAVPKGWRIKAHEASNYPARTDHKHGTAAVVEIERINR